VECAGQRDDGDPVDSSLRGVDACLKPAAQRRVGLMTQPKPGKLDHGLAQAPIAGLRDALIPFDAAALPRARPPIRRSRHLASVAGAAEQRFQPEERDELKAQAFELEKQDRRVVALLGVRADERVAARSTAASCVVTNAIRSSSRRISAFSIGGNSRPSPVRSENNRAEADCNPGRLGR